MGFMSLTEHVWGNVNLMALGSSPFCVTHPLDALSQAVEPP